MTWTQRLAIVLFAFLVTMSPRMSYAAETTF